MPVLLRFVLVTFRKMTLSLAGRSQKTAKVRVLPTVGLDPEKNRVEMMKKEEEKLRASIRRDSKQRRIRDRSRGMNAGSCCLAIISIRGNLFPARDSVHK